MQSSMGLVITPSAVSKPMDKGVTSNSSKSCEDCALHCSTILNCFIRLMDLFGSLPLENSWIVDCNLGIQVEPPTSTKSCTFFCSMPLSRRQFATRSMETLMELFQGTWPAPPYSPANCWGRRTARAR